MDDLEAIDSLMKKYDIKVSPPGAYCGKGWYNLLEGLIKELIALGWDRQLAQVKEKFGGLRFYMDSYDEKFDEPIDRAERKSYTICESCGNDGKLLKPNGYWLKTLCESCADKQKNV